MNPKLLLFSQPAREQMLKGVDIISRAVKATLGPKGRHVAMERPLLSPKVTKDGVTVAREIELEHPFQDIGAQLVKESALCTNEDVGDGTTTATVLAESLFRQACASVAAGFDPLELKRGVDTAIEWVTKNLKNLSSTLR